MLYSVHQRLTPQRQLPWSLSLLIVLMHRGVSKICSPGSFSVSLRLGAPDLNMVSVCGVTIRTVISFVFDDSSLAGWKAHTKPSVRVITSAGRIF